MDIRINYDDAYYKDDDKFIICIKNLSIKYDISTVRRIYSCLILALIR